MLFHVYESGVDRLLLKVCVLINICKNIQSNLLKVLVRMNFKAFLNSLTQNPNHEILKIRLLLFHLVVLVVACLIVFNNNKNVLFYGVDGSYFQILTIQQYKWMPFGLSFSNNPFQGLGNIFYCRNFNLMPGYFLSSFFPMVISILLYATRLFL